MSLPVIYLPEARDDVDVAFADYERQLAGLGDRFLEAVRDQVTRIQASPALYGLVHPDVRAAPIRRFPYVVYYRVEGDNIVVLAVQHGRRSPGVWQGRV